jgi:hypothetical protein
LLLGQSLLLGKRIGTSLSLVVFDLLLVLVALDERIQARGLGGLLGLDGGSTC